jgi:hypothetical protein
VLALTRPATRRIVNWTTAVALAAGVIMVSG